MIFIISMNLDNTNLLADMHLTGFEPIIAKNVQKINFKFTMISIFTTLFNKNNTQNTSIWVENTDIITKSSDISTNCSVITDNSDNTVISTNNTVISVMHCYAVYPALQCTMHWCTLHYVQQVTLTLHYVQWVVRAVKPYNGPYHPERAVKRP